MTVDMIYRFLDTTWINNAEYAVPRMSNSHLMQVSKGVPNDLEYLGIEKEHNKYLLLGGIGIYSFARVLGYDFDIPFAILSASIGVAELKRATREIRADFLKKIMDSEIKIRQIDGRL